MCLTFKHGSFSIAKLQEILQDPVSCLRVKLQYQRSMEFGHFALFENHISLRFLFITLAMHPLYIYIYIRQRPAYPANFPMASNSGYLPLFNRPIVVAVVVVVVLVSKSHPKPLLGI